jgi:UTP--glucose-1-phosphate uridylyltransferase
MEAFVGQQPFVTALGDSIIGMQAKSDIVQRMIAVSSSSRPPWSSPSRECPWKVHRTGLPSRNRRETLLKLKTWLKSPSRQEAASNLAIAARYVFAPEILAPIRRTLPGKGGEIQITDAIRQLMKDGAKCSVLLRADERRYDIGNLSGLLPRVCGVCARR